MWYCGKLLSMDLCCMNLPLSKWLRQCQYIYQYGLNYRFLCTFKMQNKTDPSISLALSYLTLQSSNICPQFPQPSQPYPHTYTPISYNNYLHRTNAIPILIITCNTKMHYHWILTTIFQSKSILPIATYL